MTFKMKVKYITISLLYFSAIPLTSTLLALLVARKEHHLYPKIINKYIITTDFGYNRKHHLLYLKFNNI